MANVPTSTAPDGPPKRVPSFRDNVKERELVRLCQDGTPDAFEELITRHQQRIFSVVRSILRRREDVEDVAQQVFIKAFVSIRSFDMRAAFSTWLYKIAVNECWDYLRRKRVRPLLYEADLSEEQNQHLSLVCGHREGAGGCQQARRVAPDRGIAPASNWMTATGKCWSSKRSKVFRCRKLVK